MSLIDAHFCSQSHHSYQEILTMNIVINEETGC